MPDGLLPKQDVDHKIESLPDAKPFLRKIFQLSPLALLVVKEYVTDLLGKDKIIPSKLLEESLLLFVKQKGQLRSILDYRALNRISKNNNAPILQTDKTFDRLGLAQHFLKLDLKTGFLQIRVHLEDIEKTAFKTKYGLFEFLVIPIKLCNVPTTSQALMNSIFRDFIDEFLVMDLHDILVFRDSKEDYRRHLRLVLSRLRKHNFYVGEQKYELMRDKTKFLRLMVGKSGIRFKEERKKLMRDWSRPTTVMKVCSFLGLEFFGRFIQDFSKIAAPLTKFMRKYSDIAN